jgi:hypothetical protein
MPTQNDRKGQPRCVFAAYIPTHSAAGQDSIKSGNTSLGRCIFGRSGEPAQWRMAGEAYRGEGPPDTQVRSRGGRACEGRACEGRRGGERGGHGGPPLQGCGRTGLGAEGLSGYVPPAPQHPRPPRLLLLPRLHKSATASHPLQKGGCR